MAGLTWAVENEGRADVGIGPYKAFRRTEMVSEKHRAGRVARPYGVYWGAQKTARRPSEAVGLRKGRRRQRIWSFRRYGGNGMQLASSDAMAAREALPVSEGFSFFSSPGAAVLFFLKEEKEKNGGAKQRADVGIGPYKEI